VRNDLERGKGPSVPGDREVEIPKAVKSPKGQWEEAKA
jgi:hypothetical protein